MVLGGLSVRIMARSAPAAGYVIRLGGDVEQLILILCIVGAVLVSSFISRFVPGVSTPLVQILLGVVARFLPFFPNVQLDPELFMVLFIAPLLYYEAHSINKSVLIGEIKLSLSLAVGLAALTMIAVGISLHAVWTTIPLAAALALGAALGPTDAVAVSSLGNDVALSSRQRSIVEGESLFNDATGVIGFQFSILAALTGFFSPAQALREFAVSFIGGVGIGALAGVIVDRLFETSRRMGWETTTTRILMELFFPFLLYLASEDIAHVSGLLVHFDRTGAGPNVSRTNIVSTSVWTVLSFSLNGSVFILLGMLLPSAMTMSWSDPGVSNWRLIALIALIAAVVILTRFLWIAVMLGLARDRQTHRRRRMDAGRCRSAAIMTLGGPKGAITLSLMLTIPYDMYSGAPFPMRNELIFIAAGVIIVTLLLANFGLPLLTPARRQPMTEQYAQTVTGVLRQTMEKLSERITQDNRRATQIVLSMYGRRIARLNSRLATQDPNDAQRLRIQALDWEQDFIERRLTQIDVAMRTDRDAVPDVQEQTPSMERLECEREAAVRLLDQISGSLTHIQGSSEIVRRMRQLRRRSLIIAKRAEQRMRHSTPMLNDDQVFSSNKRLHTAMNRYVIEKLYAELEAERFRTEDVMTLIIDYQRLQSSLRARPSMNTTAQLLTQVRDVQREGYDIELSIIQQEFEAGSLSRGQVRQLHRDVYVMQVDTDSAI